jgi:DNA polymerase V
MRDAGVNSGDILVVDRAVEPGNGKIVVAAVNGELTLKRLRVRDGRLFLCPENPTFPALEITQDTDFQIWGVATYAIHKL